MFDFRLSKVPWRHDANAASSDHLPKFGTTRHHGMGKRIPLIFSI